MRQRVFSQAPKNCVRQRGISQALLGYVVYDYRVWVSPVLCVLVIGDADRPFKSSTKKNGRSIYLCFLLLFFIAHFYFPTSGQAVVTGVVPSPPRFLPSIIIAHRVQQSHCSSIFHRVLLTQALAMLLLYEYLFSEG